MDMKANYKSTEVGIIPTDWNAKSLGDLHPFITSGSRGWAAYYSDQGDAFIRITNLTRESIYLDLTDLRYVDLPANGHEGARTQLHNGDVLVSITADIGIIGYVSATVPSPAYINQHIALVRFDSSKSNAKFVSYFLASERTQRLFRALSDSGAKAGMNLTTVKQIRVALPTTTSEQEAIAEALSDADALIESLEQLLAKKRHIKQGTMQELLTCKKRLPGFDGEWIEVGLGEMGKCHRGVSYNPVTDLSPADGVSTIRLLRSNNVQDKTLFLSDLQYVASERVSEIQRLQLDDILICMANGSRNLVGKAGRFLVDDGFQYTFGAFMGCFRPHKEKVDPRFAFYLFHTEKYRFHIDLLLAGSSINNLSPNSIEALINKVPADRSEQTAIATVLSDMDAELAALEAKLTKARQIKQGMMAELLTGRIRLV